MAFNDADRLKSSAIPALKEGEQQFEVVEGQTLEIAMGYPSQNIFGEYALGTETGSMQNILCLERGKTGIHIVNGDRINFVSGRENLEAPEEGLLRDAGDKVEFSRSCGLVQVELLDPVRGSVNVGIVHQTLAQYASLGSNIGTVDGMVDVTKRDLESYVEAEPTEMERGETRGFEIKDGESFSVECNDEDGMLSISCTREGDEVRVTCSRPRPPEEESNVGHINQIFLKPQNNHGEFPEEQVSVSLDEEDWSIDKFMVTIEIHEKQKKSPKSAEVLMTHNTEVFQLARGEALTVTYIDGDRNLYITSARIKEGEVFVRVEDKMSGKPKSDMCRLDKKNFRQHFSDEGVAIYLGNEDHTSGKLAITIQVHEKKRDTALARAHDFDDRTGEGTAQKIFAETIVPGKNTLLEPGIPYPVFMGEGDRVLVALRDKDPLKDAFARIEMREGKLEVWDTKLPRSKEVQPGTTTTIGREAEGVFLANSLISRGHFRVAVDELRSLEERTFTLTDMGSTHGTRVQLVVAEPDEIFEPIVTPVVEEEEIGWIARWRKRRDDKKKRVSNDY